MDEETVEDDNATDENDVVKIPCGACIMIEKLEGLSSNSEEEEIEEPMTMASTADDENNIEEEKNEEEKGDEESQEKAEGNPTKEI